MTPYQRIAIYQRLDHDRALTEKHLPCSLYTACAGVRNPTRKLCVGCPLGLAVDGRVLVMPKVPEQRKGPQRTIALKADRDLCACGRSKNARGRMCRKCQADLERGPRND